MSKFRYSVATNSGIGPPTLITSFSIFGYAGVDVGNTSFAKENTNDSTMEFGNLQRTATLFFVLFATSILNLPNGYAI